MCFFNIHFSRFSTWVATALCAFARSTSIQSIYHRLSSLLYMPRVLNTDYFCLIKQSLQCYFFVLALAHNPIADHFPDCCAVGTGNAQIVHRLGGAAVPERQLRKFNACSVASRERTGEHQVEACEGFAGRSRTKTKIQG